MIDQELLDELRTTAKSLEGVREVPVADADRILALVQTGFFNMGNLRWWWQDLRFEPQIIKYESPTRSNAHGVRDHLQRLLGSEAFLLLFVTDDEFPPWSAFVGTRDNILALIEESRYFEYFLVRGEADDFDWIVFDTHHNELIFSRRP